MRYISVFSGIEAASVAWQPLGWEPVAFSEIEPFPCAVLAHYYPNVPNLGDISKVDWSKFHGTVDLVVGGSPCQSFSIAGQREGMDGASGLVREYFRLLQEVKPTWFVWENVPGVFSSNGGRDFSFIVSKWHECGYNVSWRVLDAQFFGVAQRRRRVFAIGHLGNWRYPAKVLFECESLRGHTAKSRKKRQANPGCTQASPSASGCDLYNGTVTGDIAATLSSHSCGETNSRVGPYVFTPSSFGGYAEGTGTLRASGGDFGGGSEMLIAKTLCAKPGYRLNPDDETPKNQGGIAICAPIAPAIGASGPPYSRTGNERTEIEAFVCQPTIMKQREGKPGGGKGPLFGDKSFTLACGQDQTLFWQGVRRLTPLEAERLQGFPEVIHMDTEIMNRDEAIVFALINNDILVNAEEGKIYRTRGNGGRRLPEPIEIHGCDCNGYKVFSLHSGNKKWQVRAHRVIWISVNGVPSEGLVVDHINNDKTDNRISNLQLLTAGENSTKASIDGCYLCGNDHPSTKLPVELRAVVFREYSTGGTTYKQLAEKYGISKARVAQIVQNNGYTEIEFRGKPAADGVRYKALGNSMCVNVMRWIGERIQKVEDGEV